MPQIGVISLNEVMRDLRRLIHCVHIGGTTESVAPIRDMHKGKLG